VRRTLRDETPFGNDDYVIAESPHFLDLTAGENDAGALIAQSLQERVK